MSKINLDDYVEDVVFDDAYDIWSESVDKDYQKFQKIQNKKHHFKENRNFEKIRDMQKSHRKTRTDKIL